MLIPKRQKPIHTIVMIFTNTEVSITNLTDLSSDKLTCCELWLLWQPQSLGFMVSKEPRWKACVGFD